MRHVPTEFDSGESALTMLTLPEEEKEEGVDERIQRREDTGFMISLLISFCHVKQLFICHCMPFFFLSFRFYFKAPFFFSLYLFE